MKPRDAVFALVVAPAVVILGWLGAIGIQRYPVSPFLLLLTAGVGVGFIYGSRAGARSRSRIRQWWIVTTLLAAFVTGYIGVTVLAAAIVFADSVPTTPEESVAQGRGLGVICLMLWSGAVIGTQARKVGYRWGDIFMLMIPIYGPLIFLPKILWRIAGLPFRAWDKDHQPAASSTVPTVLPSSPALALWPEEVPAPSIPAPPSPRALPTAEGAPGAETEPSADPSSQELGNPPDSRRSHLLPAALLAGILAAIVTITIVSGSGPDEASAGGTASQTAVEPGTETDDEAPGNQPSPPPPSSRWRVTGTLFIPSPSARVKVAGGITVCRNAYGEESARQEARGARLSFSSDKAGDSVLGATGTHGVGQLVWSRVDGRSMCGWKVAFSATLARDSHAIFVHYGYTNSYWGPFSSAEAEKGLSLAYI